MSYQDYLMLPSNLRLLFSCLILLICILREVSSGHIYPWDLEMNYSNAGYASVFTIPFSLESGISASDYLKIVFPFKIHSTFTGNTPDELTATYAAASGGYMCGNGDYLQAAILVNVVNGENLETTSYYI
jgi:hypothetical protein